MPDEVVVLVVLFSSGVSSLRVVVRRRGGDLVLVGICDLPDFEVSRVVAVPDFWLRFGRLI